MQAIEIGDVFVGVWRGHPSQKDVDASLESVRRLRDRIGKPIVLVSVMASDVRMPTADVRKGMDASWPKLLEHASTIQYVIMPRGSTAIDYIISSRLIALCVEAYALARAGKPISVHRSLDAALKELADGVAPGIPQTEIRRRVADALKESAR